MQARSSTGGEAGDPGNWSCCAASTTIIEIAATWNWTACGLGPALESVQGRHRHRRRGAAIRAEVSPRQRLRRRKRRLLDPARASIRTRLDWLGAGHARIPPTACRRGLRRRPAGLAYSGIRVLPLLSPVWSDRSWSRQRLFATVVGVAVGRTRRSPCRRRSAGRGTRKPEGDCRAAQEEGYRVRMRQVLPTETVRDVVKQCGAGIAGCRQAAVGLVDDVDARLSHGIALCWRASIRGAVIRHNDTMNIGIVLREDRTHGLCDVGSMIEARNNNADGKVADGRSRPGRRPPDLQGKRQARRRPSFGSRRVSSCSGASVSGRDARTAPSLDRRRLGPAALFAPAPFEHL